MIHFVVILTFILSVQANPLEGVEEVCLPLKNTDLDIALAMHGFDHHKADQLHEEGNPGFMNGQIFYYHCNEGEGYRNFISLRSDLNCQASMQTQAYSSVKEYAKATSESSSSSLDVSVEVSGGAFGFSVDASAQYSTARNSEGSEAVQALESGSGEVFISTANCFTSDVSVDTYSRHRFSQNFIRGLLMLNATLDKTEEEQMAEYAKFTKTFGIEYVKRAEMGASLTYQKIFKSRSKSKALQRTRSACMSESAGGCVGFSYSGGVASVSAKACVNTAMSQCQASSGSSSEDIENSESSISIISRGSRPKSLPEWVDSDFRPIPVRIHTDLILNLLTETNLEASEEYEIPSNMLVEELKQMLVNGNKNYCTLVLGLTQEQCTENLSGCGQVDNCAPDEECINDSAETFGFRCQPKQLTSGQTNCMGEFSPGDLPGTEVKYQNVDVPTCLQRCLDDNGAYITLNAGVDVSSHSGDCWCEKNPKLEKLTGLGTTYKHAPVGLCNQCYGQFIVGDGKDGGETKYRGVSTKDCAESCVRQGADFVTIHNNNVDPDDYVGDCWCESKVTGVDTTDTKYRTAPISCKFEDL